MSKIHRFKINDEQMKDVKENICNILKMMKREDVVDVVNDVLIEMDEKRFSNEQKLKHICGTLYDVSTYRL